MAEIINGWTINKRSGKWQMVYKGRVYYEHKVKDYVTARARITKLPV